MAVNEAPARRIPEPVAEWLHEDAKRLYIGGEWVPARDGRTFTTLDPAVAEPLTMVSRGQSADVDDAVRAARAAADDAWGLTEPAERARLLFELAARVERHAEELAHLESLDGGKPIWMARGEVAGAAQQLRYFAGWATKIYGQTTAVGAGGLAYTLREPLGVCAAIVPWNYPLIQAAQKIAPALAAGNTVILKPAEQTPLTALRLAELVHEVGFPAGTVNIVTGYGGEAGAALVEHPDVDMISFTGSTAVGKQIMRSGADSLKRLLLELGGKSPNVLFADADLDDAVPEAVAGVFLNTGQTCTAGSRLLVEASAYDEVVERIAALTARLRVGDGLNDDTQIGPLVSADQRERVQRYLEQGQQEGVRAISSTEQRLPEHGYFLRPTILADVEPEMVVAQEEIFGPVLTVIPFADDADAVRLANASQYGLAAGVWTRSLERAHAMARKIRAGTVWLNSYGQYDPAVSFGGYRQSGFGRELGYEGLLAYTQTKSVWMTERRLSQGAGLL